MFSYTKLCINIFFFFLVWLYIVGAKIYLTHTKGLPFQPKALHNDKRGLHIVRGLLTVKSGLRESFRLDQIELRTETRHVQKGLGPAS